uniref:Uncharacterized protein n=1 Tax=Lepeophtheirus salmonis TaxID=72036 RepID=A0A0K2U4B7_LEPSM
MVGIFPLLVIINTLIFFQRSLKSSCYE